MLVRLALEVLRYSCFRHLGALVNFIEMSSDLVDYNSLVLALLTADPPAIAYDVTYRVLDSEVT